MNASKHNERPESPEDIDIKVKDLKTEKQRKRLFYMGVIFSVVILLLTWGVFYFWLSQDLTY